MSGKKLLIITCSVLLLEILVLLVFEAIGPRAGEESAVMGRLGPFVFQNHGMEIENFQEMKQWHLDGSSEETKTFWVFNKKTVIMSLVVDIILVVMAFLATRKLMQVPTKIQSIFELIADFFRSLVVQSLGERGKKYIPFFGSLFLFLMLSNVVVIIPFTAEPTRDLNVTVGQMLAVLFLVHFESIRVKGFRDYIHEYFQPFFIMLPLNIVGEIAKGVSLSFRLFGNILGGSIIIAVVSYLVKYTMIPVALMLFFDLGVGIVQAFVFTMLGMTYLAVSIAEE